LIGKKVECEFTKAGTILKARLQPFKVIFRIAIYCLKGTDY